MARILIVDDDEADRTFLRTLLAQEGHDVYLATDGDEAVALCRDMLVDVVMTDLQMPGVHGLELITIIRDLSPRPAIIAISGTGEPQLDVARAIGADEALAKPVDHRQLLVALARVMRPSHRDVEESESVAPSTDSSASRELRLEGALRAMREEVGDSEAPPVQVYRGLAARYGVAPKELAEAWIKAGLGSGH